MAKPPVDSGLRLVLRQMGAILKKNALLKAADWRQTLAEITIPALFMLLLVWIKTTTSVFDSPAASYSCGQTLPWRYEEHLNPDTFQDSPLYQCLQKPDSCRAENYYRDEGGVFEDMGLQDLYPTVGFMESGVGYPWYGLTIGDDSKVYSDFGRLTGVSAYNPSQDLRTLVERLYLWGEKTIIAVAPASEQQQQQQQRQQQQPRASSPAASFEPPRGAPRGAGGGSSHSGNGDESESESVDTGQGQGRGESGEEEEEAEEEEEKEEAIRSGAETAAAEELAAWLVDQLGGPDSVFGDAVRVFSSEQAVVDYVRSKDYDTPSGTPFGDDSGGGGFGDEAGGGGSGPPRGGRGIESEGGQSQGSQARARQDRRSKVGMAVIFNKAPLEGEVPQWDYTLRLNYTYGVSQFEEQATCLYPGCSLKYKLPSTLVTTSALERPPTSDHLWGYSYSGFLSLQKSVDEFILSKAAGDRMYLNVSMGFFPEQAFRTDEFQEIITSTLGIFYMLAFLYPVSRAVRVLVSEKEGRMKEALRMMGLPDLIYHGSWFITFQAQWAVTNLLILSVVWGSVFRYSDHWLVFVWLEAVALAVTAFCFLISTFFSRSKTAATLGSVIFFAAFFPYYFVGGDAVTDVSTKTWASLLVPTCMALGTDTFAAFEGGLVGVQRSNTRQSYEDRLPYVNMVAMLLVDAALYFLLAWYLDKVIPSEFGTPLPWHFPVSGPLEARRRAKRSLQQRQEVHSAVNAQAARALARRARQLKEWKGQGDHGSRDGSVNGGGAEDLAMPLLPASSQRMASREWVASSGLEGVHTYDEEGGARVEPVGPQLSQQVVEGRTVSTRGLVKVYANGKAAVKGLDLDLFEGHISVLLGHNGAGKSTAISMVTGTLPPTRGEAYLRGRRLSSDLAGVRRSLGVCFQQNTLFDQLTVLQHLRLFAVVKGVRAKDVDGEAARMVSEVGLVEKRDTLTSALSGGQKRKLSVALAFIGGSEVVVLDEPTSGMDPFSRRSTWGVLQRQRKGRVILLTTHFMDEADTLGDRIAIMAEGELRCMGSSMFLKGLYGVGYTLTVMKTDQGDGGSGGGGGGGGSIDPWERRASTSSGSLRMRAEMLDGQDSLETLILEFVPEALTVSKVGKERNYRLPFASAARFVDMFREIDRRKAELAVAGYGVSVTTLEEVFLRVGHGSEEPFPGGGDPAGGSSAHGAAIPRTRLPSVELSPGPRGRAGSAHSSYYSFSSQHGGGRGKGGGAGAGAGGAVGASSEETKAKEEEKGSGGAGEGGQGLGVEDNEPMIIGGESIHTIHTELGWPPPSLAYAHKPVEGSGPAEGTGAGVGADVDLDLDRASRGMFWVHFRALLAKRATYGLRDKKSQFFQLIVPTLLFLLGLVLLRLSRNVFDQPSLLLSAGTHFNPGKPPALRNPVPLDIDVPRDDPDPESLASAVAGRFDGVSVDGKSVVVPAGGAEDSFRGCAQGASALVNMSDFLLDAAGPPGEEGASRYGAVVLDGSSRLPNSSRLLLLPPSDGDGEGQEEEEEEGEGEGGQLGYWPGSLTYGVLINASAVHGAPIFMNLVNSAALQAIVASESSGEGLGSTSSGGGGGEGEESTPLPSITVRSSPLPRTRGEEQARQTIDGFTTAIMVVISMCFLPASYAIFVVKERAVKAKHQQIISGVGVLSYWASTFVFDVASYLVPFVVFLGLLYAFDVQSYTTGEAAGATALLFLFYGPAVAPFTYCISFLFKSASSAQTMVLFVNFVTGLALMVVSFVLNLVESTRDANAKLKWVYRLFPGFCLGDGLAQLVLCEDGKTCVDISNLGRGPPEKLTPLSWAITGADIASLIVTCLGYLVICLLIEHGSTSPKLLAWFNPDPTADNSKSNSSDDETGEEEDDDEDVAAEARRVEARWMGMGGTLGDMEGGGQVILNNLRKVYRTKQGPKVAVQGLSFSVSRGDCFGFLGINGAGKSTTLGILSGDICPTRGQASIAGHDILTEQSKLRRYIGYCPQDDALLDLLTAEEHLLLYARIKGVKETRLKAVADEKMKEMDLTSFRSVKACELSGGNKRKLSVAIAMIGNPRVVFLDEPSTGMDPIARRFMWDIISRMTTTDRECCVILTTHSMEEAESLCNNIGIMVNGRLRCLGSTQHLKHRFGRGFEADIKMHPPSNAEAAQVMQRIVKEDVDNLVGDELNSSRLRPPLDKCCRGLERGDTGSGNGDGDGGDSTRTGAIEAALKDGSGGFLFDVLGSEGGTLPTRLFIDWYLCEQRTNDLKAFLEKTFPGAELVERPTLFSCRYKIPHQDGMNLADVFGHFEAAKAKLGLASYAVGQTTLEQIFNGFAASKDNPEVMLRQGQGQVQRQGQARDREA